MFPPEEPEEKQPPPFPGEAPSVPGEPDTSTKDVGVKSLVLTAPLGALPKFPCPLRAFRPGPSEPSPAPHTDGGSLLIPSHQKSSPAAHRGLGPPAFRPALPKLLRPPAQRREIWVRDAESAFLG